MTAFVRMWSVSPSASSAQRERSACGPDTGSRYCLRRCTLDGIAALHTPYDVYRDNRWVPPRQYLDIFIRLKICPEAISHSN